MCTMVTTYFLTLYVVNLYIKIYVEEYTSKLVGWVSSVAKDMCFFWLTDLLIYKLHIMKIISIKYIIQ